MSKYPYLLVAIAVSLAAALMLFRNEEQDARPFLQSGEWNLVCIFPPYTPVSTVSKHLGGIMSDRFEVAPIDTDAVFLLVFLAQGRIEKQIRHSRNHGDFLMDEPGCFKRGDPIPIVAAIQ